jgi:WD40 repeat protein
VTSLRVIPKHRRLICGSRIFKVFEYTKPFVPESSDDNPIQCALFSPIRFEFYIAGEKSIKIWNAKTGKPVRVLKNIFESDITCMDFDYSHRKLIAGNHLGQVKVFDLLSGIMTH